MRTFMEYETLVETQRKLPKFARQFGVPVAELTRDGLRLPYIRVVKIPPALRELDQRALEVRRLDPDDYPAAVALAALLSPCILLTGNHTTSARWACRARSRASRPWSPGSL